MKKGLFTHLFSLVISITMIGCANNTPLTQADLSKPENVSKLLSNMQLTEDQLKGLRSLLVQLDALKTGSTNVSSKESELLQKIADLEQKRTEMSNQLTDLQKKDGELDRKITSTDNKVNGQKDAIMSDVSKLLATQIPELKAQKELLESKLNESLVKLADLDSKTKLFMDQNENDISVLFDGINELKLNNGLSNEQVQIAKDLEDKVNNISDLFSTIFHYAKTGNDELEENRQILEKLMVHNLARFSLIDTSNPSNPFMVGSGSANLLLKVNNTLVFSTASHVSQLLYFTQRGIGTKTYGLHIGPVQMLPVKDMAPIPVGFDYTDTPGVTNVIVSDTYKELMDQEADLVEKFAQAEERILEIYQVIYGYAKQLSFAGELDLIPASDLDEAGYAYSLLLDIEDVIDQKQSTLSNSDKTLTDSIAPLLDEMHDIVDETIYPTLYAIMDIDERAISEDSALVVVEDPSQQLKGLKPLLTYKNGVLIPQTVDINGQPFIIPFTIDNLIGKGVANVGLTSEIYACGIPFNSSFADTQDVTIDYNGQPMGDTEADVWFERKQITRTLQPKPNGNEPGSKKGIPNYFQVSGSMGAGSSGGLNFTVESYKAKVLTQLGQVILTKEGKVILLGYDNTLRTSDALPVYLGSEGLFTEHQDGSFLRIVDKKISDGQKTLTTALAWSDMKSIQGLGVNSFTYSSFFTGDVTSHVTNFSQPAKGLREKLEAVLNITLPELYKVSYKYSLSK